ncbi:MAG TPA: FecR domain-containing protein [Candidatus Limnocylindria bacterium]|nr:FecR domain-containing protein [Candidatus Limnocylindria bacterium]
MKLRVSKKLIALIVVLLLVGGVAYLYVPRDRGLSAAVAATLAIFNTDITSQKGGGGDFTPALDGDLLSSGDVVKSSTDGRAVLTFFDGSSLTVETGSVVKVTTLDRLENGGIRLVIEQSLGRTWASVAKLKTPDSKFEIKTPTSTASVRGTAFETVVEQRPDGTTSVTYKADDGEVVVTANAGGQTSVTANTQVTIAQNQPAPPAAAPIPPSPTLRVTSSAGIGFALTAPTGTTCGSAGNKAEIPGCLVNGNVVTIREPVVGRYIVMMTSATAAVGATLRVEALRGTNVESTQTLTRTFALGDLVRTAFTYAPQAVGAFEPAEQITSVCGAQATGRVFSAGTIDERYSLLESFASTNRGTPVSLVVTEGELAAAITRAVDGAGPNAPAYITDVRISVDGSGIHLSGNAVTPVGTFAANSDVVMGPMSGKLVLRLRNLSAGPIPSAILQQMQAAIERGMNEFTDTFPMVVRQVALRPGCLGIMGTTP